MSQSPVVATGAAAPPSVPTDVPRPAGRLPLAASGLIGVTLVLLVAAAGGQLAGFTSKPGAAWRLSTLHVPVAVTYSVLGGLVLWRAPRNASGWFMVVLGVAGALPMATASYCDRPLAAWLTNWTFWPLYGLLPLHLLLFPTGRLPSPRWRVLALAGIAATAVPSVVLAVASWGARHGLVARCGDAPSLGALAPAGRSAAAAALLTGVLLLAVTAVGALAALVARWRRTTPDTRSQFAVLGAAAAWIAVVLLLETRTHQPALLLAAAVAVPLAMIVVVLRYGLYDLDLFLNRSIVYPVLTLSVIGGYVLLVAFLGEVVGFLNEMLGVSWPRPTESILATAVVAVAFQPARERIQRGVNHLLYGDRDEPYAVVSRLGQRLERAVRPDAVLSEVVETVAETLRVPFAAVEVLQGGDYVRAADVGRLAAEPEGFAMTYQGRPVGRLMVAPRSPGQAFTARERALLEDLARQAGVAVQAVRLTTDLRLSRERLVRSREEERRRLRRDLHDGLGPALAGIIMQMGAARSALDGHPAVASGLLATLEQELQHCVVEVRRVVDDLRPPALDELGLVGAIRRQVALLAPPQQAPAVRVVASDDVAGLPAAVEVAAYRIVTEAVTNVVRHAGARSCVVSLRVSDRLDLEVTDDGRGLPPAGGIGREGVGLESMRQRAEELGGVCTVESVPAGGTRVRAFIPLGG